MTRIVSRKFGWYFFSSMNIWVIRTLAIEFHVFFSQIMFDRRDFGIFSWGSLWTWKSEKPPFFNKRVQEDLAATTSKTNPAAKDVFQKTIQKKS